MPIITQDEIDLMQNARIISDIQYPVQIPLNINVDDPLLIFKGNEGFRFKPSSITAGNQDELMIDEQLYLKRYMNKAVAEK